MPRLSTDALPKYGKHKQSGQARVVLNGRHYLLGPHGSKTSREEYDRLVAEWIANGRQVPGRTADLTISTLIVRFWQHAQAYYRDSEGHDTREADNFRDALGPLRRLYGATAAAEFGPLALKGVRCEMLRPRKVKDTKAGQEKTRPGWSRTYTNRQIARIKQVFRWAAENELLAASVYHALETVAGLRKGRTEARETDPVKPVPHAHVDATLPKLNRHLQAMVKLQLLTGMRSSEVCWMRSGDIDTTGAMWVYRPSRHKTQHHGHDREIYLNQAAQSVVSPFLKPDLQAFIFSPIEAEAERLEQLRAKRKTPVQPSQLARAERAKRRKRSRPPGKRYHRESFRNAVARACRRAGVPTWHPHQLRHNFGTRMRKAHGLEVARILLGHKSAAMTLVYAEADRQKAIDAIAAAR